MNRSSRKWSLWPRERKEGPVLFESFRKRLLAEKVLTFGPPKGPMAIEAEGPGSRKGKHTPGHHVYQIDFT